MKKLMIIYLVINLVSCTTQKVTNEEVANESFEEKSTKSKYKFDKRLIGSWVKSLYATQGIRINEDGTMGTYLVSDPEKFGLNTLVIHIETFERNKESYLVSHAYNENGEETFTKEVKYKIEKDTLFLPRTVIDQETGEKETLDYKDKYFRVEP